VAGRALIEILYVHDFETRLIHVVIRVEVRVGRKMSRGNHIHDRWVRELAALRIVEDIDLDLPHTAVELFGQRRVLVVQAPQSLWMMRFQQLPLAWRKSRVIAVVRPDYLDLVDVDVLVLVRLCHLLSRRAAGYDERND
jgi:hypothetical protein